MDMLQHEIVVPDIGDFQDVLVIEILVRPGERVEVETPLITLETDKATMEIPSPVAGTVTELRIAEGARVSTGDPIMLVALSEARLVEESRDAPGEGAGVAPSVGAPQPVSRDPASEDVLECEVLVLGAGPGGYSAAFRSADLGMRTVIVERFPRMGGVCLNVGCIPSKALLHIAELSEKATALADHGVTFGRPTFDPDRMRAWKDRAVERLTDGLAGMARARNVEVVQGVARFLDANHVEVEAASGEEAHDSSRRRVVRFSRCIIATGSRGRSLPFLPSDPRVLDSTAALEIPHIPERMLVVGGGVIGLELATVYSALGARLDIVEVADDLMPGADRDLVRVWEKANRHRFDRILLQSRAVEVSARDDGLWVQFEGAAAPSAPERYDMLLQAVGRIPNSDRLNIDRTGVRVDSRGFIEVDGQMRTRESHIFAIGDLVGEPMLAHKAVHQGHVAAEAAHGSSAQFDARVIPAVAYTSPEIAWAGVTESQAAATGTAVLVSRFPWSASGKAIATGTANGVTKLIFDPDTQRVVGGGIVGAHAGDLISEIALAIEMGADALDIARTIHPHPTLGESVGMAAEVFLGTCTDLPPDRRRTERAAADRGDAFVAMATPGS